MNSHIQMPKAILKNFVNEHETFNYYDVVKGYIGTKGTAGSTNTKQGYYSNEVETILNKEVETPVSILVTKIKRMRGGNSFILDQKNRQIIYNYANSLFFRDPIYYKEMLTYSKTIILFSEQQQRDLCVLSGLSCNSQIQSNYSITILFNRTSIPFVLPICGIYPLKKNGEIYFISPVTPHEAIIFVNNKNFDELIDKDGNLNTLYVDDEYTIERMNLRAFEEQCNRKWGVIVSTQYDLLYQLKNIHNNNVGDA